MENKSLSSAMALLWATRKKMSKYERRLLVLVRWELRKDYQGAV